MVRINDENIHTLIAINLLEYVVSYLLPNEKNNGGNGNDDNGW